MCLILFFVLHSFLKRQHDILAVKCVYVDKASKSPWETQPPLPYLKKV